MRALASAFHSNDLIVTTWNSSNGRQTACIVSFKGVVSVINPFPDVELLQALEGMSVKHIFQLSDSSSIHVDDSTVAPFVERFDAKVWACNNRRMRNAAHFLIAEASLLPFPGVVFMFRTTPYDEAAIFIPKASLLIVGDCIHTSTRGSGAAVSRDFIEANYHHAENQKPLVQDFERLLSIPWTNLVSSRGGDPILHGKARSIVVECVARSCRNGELTGYAPPKRGVTGWLFLLVWLIDVALILLYIYQRGL